LQGKRSACRRVQP